MIGPQYEHDDDDPEEPGDPHLHFRIGLRTLCGASGVRTTTDRAYFEAPPGLGAEGENCERCEAAFADDDPDGSAEYGAETEREGWES